MDDRQISKFAIFAAYVAAGSLVSSETLQAILMRPGDHPSLLQALRAIEAPRAEHTDPELPQLPGLSWGPAIAAVSSATAATEYAFMRPTK